MIEHNDAVYLQLDRPRQLRLGHKALKMFSALRHVPLSRIDQTMDNYDDMSCLVYCVLVQDDPALTVERLDERLDAVPVKTLLEKVTDMTVAAFGDEDGGEDGGDGAGDPPAAAGTGTGA